MQRKILVAYDFSDVARRALRWAAELVADGGGTLTLLYVYPMAPPVVGPEVLAPLPTVPPVEDLRAFEQRLRDAAGIEKLEVSAHAVAAPAVGPAIVEHAREVGADVVVLGTHGRTGVVRAVLGSVAEHVVRHADCPVVTIRDVHPPHRT